MNIDDAFGNNLKAEDVQGREFHVVISGFEMQEMNDGKIKPVLQFEKARKGLVLNATRKEAMKTLYGGETDNWLGKAIVICHGMTSFQGKPTGTIEIKGPPTIVPTPQEVAEPNPAGVPPTDLPTPVNPPTKAPDFVHTTSPQSAAAAGLPELGDDEVPF